MNESLWKFNPVIAAVRDDAGIRAAVSLQNMTDGATRAAFLLGGDIQSLPGYVGRLKAGGMAVFAHIDLIDGIGKDAAGVRYLCAGGVDGLISTRAQLLRAAREAGLLTVHRVFLLDSDSLETGVRLLSDSHADCCEVMPGLVPKAIRHLRGRIRQPIIAGGMITEREEVQTALDAGAIAVSTSKPGLWSL